MRSTQAHWRDFEFAADADSALSIGTSPALRWLLYTIGGFFFVAIVWASLATIDEVTRAEGKVIPSSQVQVIQYLEGGIVEELAVDEGAFVKKGQVLARVDDTAFVGQYRERLATQRALEGRIERLVAEAEGNPLSFSEELVENRPDVVDSERELYDARQADLQQQVRILEQQATQKRQELSELRSQKAQLEENLSLAQEELDITRPLADKGVVSRIELLRLQREIADLKGEIATIKVSISRASTAIEEADQRIQEKILNFRARAREELAATRAEKSALDETIAAARDRVNRTEIVSPVDGIVKELKLRTVGGVLQPGETLMEIVPIEESLLIQSKVRPADIAFIHPGQEAKVKLSAYDFAVYGGLNGEVQRISADTIRDEQGNEFYEVIVRTDESTLKRGDRDLPIIPGMIATVDIITGEKSVMAYLMKPITRARDRALTER